MLQALLAERLKLKVHWESKELSLYALTIAKSGLRLHKAAVDPDADPQALPMNAQNTGQDKRIQGKMPISYLQLFMAGDLDRPLVDMTGLADAYEIDLQYTPMPPPSQSTSSQLTQEEISALRVSVATSLGSALETQLGIHLEARKAPVEMLVIDHVDGTPTEN
jgi:uncharacterized protein (TIGR03435 family)